MRTRRSYAGADVSRMALTLVNEQADEVVARLYADYCRNRGRRAPQAGAQVGRPVSPIDDALGGPCHEPTRTHVTLAVRSAPRSSRPPPPRSAQPTFGNPSPTAGSETSQKANAAADQTVYQAVDYTNASKKGPALVVIPGEIKSNNATFLQKFTANNIADFGEIELSSANFQVLERSNLGPLLQGVRARLQPRRSATRRASSSAWASSRPRSTSSSSTS